MIAKGLQLSLFCVCCCLFAACKGQSHSTTQSIEKLIAGVVDKVMASSVYIIEWDTLNN
jgi:serine protease Do